MKERSRYWKHILSDKPFQNVNFTFDLFLQALQIIATHGFEKMKDDLPTRMQLLFKHIYDIMNGEDITEDQITLNNIEKPKTRSPGTANRTNPLHSMPDTEENRRKIYKNNSSDVFITSNRSGVSTKSSRARKNSSQTRKSKQRRKSSQKKRSRRYAANKYQQLLYDQHQSFTVSQNKLKENSLPALTAIYGSSLDTYKNVNRRNNSGLAGIDLSNQRKRKMNIDRVYNTIDTKSYNKNNSLSLVVNNGAKNLNDSFTVKKSPTYGKRNMSLNNHRTFDESNAQKHETATLLDLDSKLSLLSKNPNKKLSGIRNYRYKLHALIEQRKKFGSNRKKSSNSKKRNSKTDKSVRGKLTKAKLNKKLIDVNSYSGNNFLLQNQNSEKPLEQDLTKPHEKSDDYEEIMSNNPEDCKDTIFSGEGEILGTAGETDHKPVEMVGIDTSNLTNEELIVRLQKENQLLKSTLKNVMTLFNKFKKNSKSTPVVPVTVKNTK